MATNKTAVSHPSYHEMIGEAITALKDRTGSSQVAIAKYIEEKHKGLPENFKKMLSVQLKRLAASGKLTKVKASFKLAKPVSSEKKTTKSKGASVKKAKTTVKKKAAPAKSAQMKKKAVPSKAKVTPAKKKVTAVAKPKVKKVGKSSAKKAAVAKKATK